MDWVNIFFWVFSIVAGISAAAVISVRNPVYAVLCLILTFFSVACIWIWSGLSSSAWRWCWSMSAR